MAAGLGVDTAVLCISMISISENKCTASDIMFCLVYPSPVLFHHPLPLQLPLGAGFPSHFPGSQIHNINHGIQMLQLPVNTISLPYLAALNQLIPWNTRMVMLGKVLAGGICLVCFDLLRTVDVA